ncbi:unnamed protein product [Caenorhabditis bovis]|uniref:Nuclear receptor domain-containing protein n=1 Tax=Caenorhabditis bovis TaxID=2654633 RepID=A0A8S1F8E3_9PELO|nr:unnamed protein product [Caenorhabditis bovis]
MPTPPGVLCGVCGDKNGQSHYGTICCPSCKGFFRRVFIAAKNMECTRGNCCEITKRNICRACRYRKCLSIGMNVREIRGRNKMTAEDRMQMQRFESPVSPTIPTMSTILVPIDQIDAERALEMGQIYLNLEKFCESTVYEQKMPIDEENALIDRMMNSALSDFLLKTSPQCPRFKRTWKPYKPGDWNRFVRSWARSMVHFLDFATKVPLFNSLCMHDRKCWYSTRMPACAILTMAYHTRLERCEGLLFGDGDVFPLKPHLWHRVDDDSFRTLFIPVTRSLFNGVVVPMIRMKFTDVHYALLKSVIFYSQGTAVTTMTPPGTDAINREFERHKKALTQLLFKDAHNFTERAKILFQLDDMISAIERATVLFFKEMRYFDLCEVDLTKRPLWNECFVERGFILPP